MFYGEPTLSGGSFAQDHEFNKLDRADEFTGGSVPSAGNATGFGDVWAAAHREQMVARNFNSRVEALEQAFDRRIATIKELTGQSFDNPYRMRGPLMSAYRGIRGDQSIFDEFEEKAKKVAEQFPEYADRINLPRHFEADQNLIARRAVRNAENAYDRYGGLWGTGTIAQFGGAFSGMMMDPANAFANLALGFSRAGPGLVGMLGTAARNAGLNAGIEIASAPYVQQRRKDAGVEYGYDHAAQDVAFAALFGGAIDLGVRGTYRGVQTSRGMEPQLDVKGNIAGWVPKGQAIDPKKIEAIQQGDVEAAREVARDLGIDKEPEVRTGLDAAEYEADISKAMRIEGVDDATGLRTFVQAARAASDPDEPPPRMPDRVNREISELREQLAREGDASRDILDRMPDHKASEDAWREFAKTAARDDIRAVANRHVEALASLRGRIRDLETRINDRKTSPVEVARIFKEDPAIVSRVTPTSSERIEAARYMARLSNDLLDEVEAGLLPPRQAALIGELVEDVGKHESIARTLQEVGPTSREHTRKIIGEELQRGNEVATQASILGLRDGANLSEPQRLSEPVGKAAKEQIARLSDQVGHGRTMDDAIDAFAEAVEEVSPMLPKNVRVALSNAHGKMASFHDDLIEISFAAIDPKKYLRHEAIHALKKVGAFDDTEWRMLVDLAEREGVLQKPQSTRQGPDGKEEVVTFEQAYREAYDGYRNVDELLKEEAVANLIEHHIAGKRYGNAADTILGRVVELIRQIAKSLKLRGFETVDDVIDRLMSGEIVGREGSLSRQTGLMHAISNFDSTPITPGLDMSKEARLQRAREMGFDTGTVYYHGTGRAFDRFNRSSSPQTLGDGVYLSPDANFAAHFVGAESPSILPTYVRGKQFVWDMTDKAGSVARAKEIMSDMTAETPLSELSPNLEKAGYTSLASREGDGSVREVVVFDPTNIRSVNAAFDPARADSPNLMYALSGTEGPPALPAGALSPIDDLGFYSKAVRAAKAIKQAKGTPEQMLAQLRKAGVKQAEIEATGLDEFLDGQKSITRDGMVAFLELQQVPVREARYGARNVDENAIHDEAARLMEQGNAATGNWTDDPSIVSRVEELQGQLDELIAHRNAKWSSYSLDPSNPTYRETVLHLPSRDPNWMSQPDVEARQREIERLSEDAGFDVAYGIIDPRFQDEWDRLEAMGWSRESEFDFRNGHFSELNAISHLRTSMQPDAEGKNNYVINELQSDWGQKIRDSGGARDEAKIAELQKQYSKIENDIRYLETSDALTNTEKRLVLSNSASDFWSEDQRRYHRLLSESRRLTAEIGTQTNAAPGHPLVNTTDQWVNTSLRRALRQAVESDADYIAIASGETVDSFGMGAPLPGLQYAYNEMYPKKLRDIIKKIDKDAAKPEKIGALKSHDGTKSVGGSTLDKAGRSGSMEMQSVRQSGERWLVELQDGRTLARIFDTEAEAKAYVTETGGAPGFTRFPITDKIRQKVMGEGQPLFALSRDSMPEPEPASRDAFEAEMAQTRRMINIHELVEACRG